MAVPLLQQSPRNSDFRITLFFNVLRVFVSLWLTLVMVKVVGAAPVLPVTVEEPNTIVLSVSGLINSAEPIQLSYKDLQALPLHEVRTSTAVTDGVIRFQGVLMRDLLDSLGADGKVVNALAVNGYSINIPATDFQQFDVLIAWSADGQLLDSDDKGPLWLIYPRDQFKHLQDIRYDYRWVWQLNHLTVK